MDETFSALAEKRGVDAVLHLSGLIDSMAEPALQAAYEEAERLSPQTVTLDFSNVTYMNSTGIALIVSLLAQARAAQLPLVASGLSDHYREIFTMTRLSDFIEIQ